MLKSAEPGKLVGKLSIVGFERHTSMVVTAGTLMSPTQLDFERNRDATEVTDPVTAPDCQFEYINPKDLTQLKKIINHRRVCWILTPNNRRDS